jgi:hypothetical protein
VYENALYGFAKTVASGDRNAAKSIHLMLKDTYTRPFFRALQDETVKNCMKYLENADEALDDLEKVMMDMIIKANTSPFSKWIMEWFEKVQNPVMKAIRYEKAERKDADG